jgi:hypothetical protein
VRSRCGGGHDLRQWDETLLGGTDTGQGHNLARLNFDCQALDPGDKRLRASRRYLCIFQFAPSNVAFAHSSSNVKTKLEVELFYSLNSEELPLAGLR